jgi:hypothetical protein
VILITGICEKHILVKEPFFFRSVYLVLLEGNANINGEQFEAVDTGKSVLKKTFENLKIFTLFIN